MSGEKTRGDVLWKTIAALVEDLGAAGLAADRKLSGSRGEAAYVSYIAFRTAFLLIQRQIDSVAYTDDIRKMDSCSDAFAARLVKEYSPAGPGEGQA